MNKHRWYVLGVLLAIYMVHHLDRQVVSLLLVPIGGEFQLSDSQLGLLAGSVYAISFAIAGIPLGMLVDRVHRVRLLSLLVAAWSGLTALCATASTFASLILMRIGIAAAESGGTPTNLSLLSDYFEKRNRSTAVGLYMMGPQLGTVVGFALAGVIASRYGWRAAFLAAGIPGIALATLAITTLREPQRGQGDAQVVTGAAPAFLHAARLIWDQPALVHMIAGLTIASTVAAGTSSWLPALLMRSHGVTIQTAGLSVAFGISILAAMASALGGWLSDRLGANNLHVVPLLAACAAILTIPCVLLGSLASSFVLSVAAFAFQTALHMLINTPSYAGCLALAPAQIRGTTTAVIQVLGNLIGYGVGPQLVGMLSDAFKLSAGTDSLRYALILFAFFNLWSVAHLLVAARRIRRG